MNTTMGHAFERAGFSPAAIRWASACYDLARLALNREPDPRRAVPRWQGMTHRPDFQEEIVAYLTAVKEEMKPSGAGDDQTPCVETIDQSQTVAPASDPVSADDDHSDNVQQDQIALVASAGDPISSEDEDLLGDDAQQSHMQVVPSSDPNLAEGEDHAYGVQQQDHISGVPPSVSPAERRAQRELARIQRSFYLLTDQHGTEIAIEDIVVRKIDYHMRWIAGRSVKYATDFMVLRSVRQFAPQVTDDFTTIGECMPKFDLLQAVRKGKRDALSCAEEADAMMAQIAHEQVGHA